MEEDMLNISGQNLGRKNLNLRFRIKNIFNLGIGLLEQEFILMILRKR